MFIRIKKIKNISYAYLVESVWKSGKAKQKVIKYLGKIYTPQKQNTISFPEFCGQENKQITEQASYSEIRSLLATWTLLMHGFAKDQLMKEKWIWQNGKVIVDPKDFSVWSRKKEITLKLNDGYMNTYSVQQLFTIELNKRTMEQRQAATVLAKAFVSAGIQIPSDIFIMVFEKVYKE